MSAGSSSVSNQLMANQEILEPVDWTTRGMVTPVRKQGPCQCCWAVVATGIVESLYAISHPEEKKFQLSIQELIDCYIKKFKQDKWNLDKNNCYTLTINKGLTYIQKFRISKEEDYPYQSRKGSCLSELKPRSLATINGIVTLEDDDAIGILKAITEHPVGAAIDIYESLLKYKKGIYQGREGNEICQGCHAVLIVGFDTEKEGSTSTDYFFIKNSWGPSWGLNGFAKVKRSLLRRVCYATMERKTTRSGGMP